jgi:hypothetical protein
MTATKLTLAATALLALAACEHDYGRADWLHQNRPGGSDYPGYGSSRAPGQERYGYGRSDRDYRPSQTERDWCYSHPGQCRGEPDRY